MLCKPRVVDNCGKDRRVVGVEVMSCELNSQSDNGLQRLFRVEYDVNAHEIRKLCTCPHSVLEFGTANRIAVHANSIARPYPKMSPI